MRCRFPSKSNAHWFRAHVAKVIRGAIFEHSSNIALRSKHSRKSDTSSTKESWSRTPAVSRVRSQPGWKKSSFGQSGGLQENLIRSSMIGQIVSVSPYTSTSSPTSGWISSSALNSSVIVIPDTKDVTWYICCSRICSRILLINLSGCFKLVRLWVCNKF